MKWYDILKAGPWGYLSKQGGYGSQITYNGNVVGSIPSLYEQKFSPQANEKSIVSMLNSVWQMMGNKVEYANRSIDVRSHSGHLYTINLFGTSYCKFDVDTDKDSPIGRIPVRLCIDVGESGERPYGDILASWILTLINDEESAQDIDTLYDFLHGGYIGGVQCQFCNTTASFELEDIPERFFCEECNVYSCDLGPGELGPGETEMNLEREYEEYNCPSCRGDVELFWAGWDNVAICHDERLVATPEGGLYPVMIIDRQLTYGELQETDDEDVFEYDTRLYRYTDGIEAEQIPWPEEEE